MALLLGWKSIRLSFAFNITHEFTAQKQVGSLRIVSWNVARFVELKKNNNPGSQTRLKMMDLLKQQNADILCLQEFHTASRTDYYDNITYIQKELGYPYYHFSFDEDGAGIFYSSVIFSRIPILNTGIIKFPLPSLPEALLYADIKLDDDTVRIFTSHLQSVRFNKDDYSRIEKIKEYADSFLTNSKTVFSKVKWGSTYRSLQVNVVKEKLTESPYPVIMCGDFNDVPNSYTYSNIRGDLQDAFLEKGFGIGRTFTGLSPTLRIDYILASRELSVLQFKRVTKKYSDHYMIVADIKPKASQQ
jgi:endonuclease/exonuclease/phosphatase family metal-dependent hydrolase